MRPIAAQLECRGHRLRKVPDALEERERGLNEQRLLVESERDQIHSLELRSDSIKQSDAHPDEVAVLRLVLKCTEACCDGIIRTAAIQPAQGSILTPIPEDPVAGFDRRHKELHHGTRSVERMSAVLTVVTLSGVVSLSEKWRMARTQFSTTLLGHVCDQLRVVPQHENAEVHTDVKRSSESELT